MREDGHALVGARLTLTRPIHHARRVFVILVTTRNALINVARVAGDVGTALELTLKQ